MRSLMQRLRAIKPKQAALLLAVAALAATACFGGREAGVGRPTEAGTTVAQEQPAEPAPQNSGEETNGESDVEPLTLTLKAPTICRVKPADRDLHAIVGPIDEDGENEEQYEFGEWFGVANVLVRWQASGGAPPYTLVIDGEPRDAHNEYVGEAGGALVSCALEIGETYFDDRWGEAERWHRTEPTVDSGLKTIHATVTDNAGATASASIGVHAILKTGGGLTVLEAGKTYRVEGRLMTVPEGIDITIGDREDSDCEGTDCESHLSFFAEDGPHRVSVSLGLKTGQEGGGGSASTCTRRMERRLAYPKTTPATPAAPQSIRSTKSLMNSSSRSASRRAKEVCRCAPSFWRSS